MNVEEIKAFDAAGIRVSIFDGKITNIEVKISEVKYITDPSQLEVGRDYYLLDKETQINSLLPHAWPLIEECKERDGYKYFSCNIWATEGNNQALERWDIFGPIPKTTLPDFNALKRAALEGK